MRIIVVQKNSFRTVEWINVVSIRIDGSNWIVTNVAEVSTSYAVADYNIYILGVEV